MKMRIGWLLLCFLIFLGLPAKSTYASLSLHVDLRGEKALILTGTLSKNTNSFSRSLRLTIHGGNAQKLNFLSSDLLHDNGETFIDPSQVTIPSGLKIIDQQPFDVLVTISNVQRPGRYKGILRFWTEPKLDEVLEIPLMLLVTIRPDVKPLASNPILRLVGCRWWELCSFTDSLLPTAIVGKHLGLRFENVTGADVVVEPPPKSLLDLGCENGSLILSDQEVNPPWPGTLPNGGITFVPLGIERASISACRYNGSLRLKLKDRDELVVAPFTLEVRDGVSSAGLVILVSIIFGRWIHQRKDENPTNPTMTRKVLCFMAGTDVNENKAMPLAKPLAFLGFLVLLTMIGLKTLYIEIPTFGAQGIFDYLGLVLWGISADIAQRTLQNLPTS